MKKTFALLALAACLLASCDSAAGTESSASQATSSSGAASGTESIPAESIPEGSSAPQWESSLTEIELSTDIPEESDPQPGLGGDITQLVTTHEYEKQIGLCYSIDLSEYEQYIDPVDASEYLLLVNAQHPLGKNYEPENLIYIEDMRAGRPSYFSYLREVPEKALEAFLDEAAMYGHGDIKVSNGYRSYSTQSSLFNSYVDRELANHPGWTYEQAYNYVGFYDKNNPGSGYSAVPGTSEHQSGLCVDMHNQINTDHTFDDTPAAHWLAENCYRFGFVLRFPKEKEDITGIQFESWHFRFVGRTAATEMHELDMCLEEYLEYKGIMP